MLQPLIKYTWRARFLMTYIYMVSSTANHALGSESHDLFAAVLAAFSESLSIASRTKKLLVS